MKRTMPRFVGTGGGVEKTELPESCCWGLNPGPRPYQGRALPLSYSSVRSIKPIGNAREDFPLYQLGIPSCVSRKPVGGPDTYCKAGEGNRTLVACLEGRCSTIELHPQRSTGYPHRPAPKWPGLPSGQGGIRTPVERSSPDLQSGAIGRSATCPPPPSPATEASGGT
jgi:hypothetical protein